MRLRRGIFIILTSLSSLAFSEQSLALALAPLNETPLEMEALSVLDSRLAGAEVTTLKTNLKIFEIPRSLTVVSSQRISEQDFQTGADLLLWTPGFASNGDSYHFYARGFRMLPGDWKVDGFSGRVIGGSYAPNLFGVESVTLLKGPAGLLYGATSSPGGQISFQSKQPKEQAAMTFETRVNTFDLKGSLGAGVSLDATGPLGSSRRYLYRLLAKVEEAQPKPAFGDQNQFYRLSLAFSLDPSGGAWLYPMFEWSRENREARGVFISPSSSLSTSDKRTDYTLEDLSPLDLNLAAGARRDLNLTTGTDLRFKWGEVTEASVSYRYHERLYTNESWTVQTASLAQSQAGEARSWTVKRRHGLARSEVADHGLDAQLSHRFNPLEAITSQVQAGFYLKGQETQAFTATSGKDQSAINIYSGFASAPLLADASRILLPSTKTELWSWNLYLQLQNRLWERWLLSGSGGYTADKTHTGGDWRERSSSLTPNASLVYLLSKKWNLYTSFSTSYNLPTATYEDKEGHTGVFDPIQGDSLEVGVKSELFGDLLSASVSLFDTALNRVLVQSDPGDLNPQGNRYYRQLDSGRKSRGLELEFLLSPSVAWSHTFTYAYVDAFNRNTDGSRGFRAEMTPKHALSLASRYQVQAGLLKGLWLRLGGLWQSERAGGASAATATTDPLVLRSFHRLDASLGYPYGAWSISLAIENLLDRRYALGGSTGLGIDPGNPRSTSLRLSRTW